MGNFYTDTLQKDSRFNSTAACNDMDMLEPVFRAQVKVFIAAAEAQGISLHVTETYRSSQRQQQLFDQGKTQLRTVGVHHYGLACDFAKVVDGKLSWDGDWTFCATMAKEASTADRVVISGSDWGEPDQPHSFRDWDHIQGCTIANQTGLFSGTWYPDDDNPTPAVAPVPAIALPAAAPAAPPADLTPAQAYALEVFDAVNAQSFGGWFKRSTFMAFCETESDFDPNAFRQEPSGVASYGLMQVLDSTAAGLGLVGAASQMYQPNIGIFYGLKYAAQGWNYLSTHFGRQPTLGEWSAGYNEGYGAAANGRPDPGYVATWEKHLSSWQYLDTLA